MAGRWRKMITLNAIMAALAMIMAGSSVVMVAFSKSVEQSSSVEATAKDNADNFVEMSSEYDLGTILAGDVTPKHILVKNRSDRPIRLRIVDSTCSCISAACGSDPIAPGGTGQISVVVDSSSVSKDPFSRVNISAQALADGGRNASVALPEQTYSIAIRGKIDWEMGLVPAVANFGNVSEEDGVTSLPIEVRVPAGEGFGADSLVSPIDWPKHLKLQIAGSRVNNKVRTFTGVVELHGNEFTEVRRTMFERLKLRVQSPDNELQCALVAKASFRSAIECRPEVVYCKRGSGESMQMIDVRHRDGIAFRIGTVVTSVAPLVVTAGMPDERGAYKLRVDFSRVDSSGGLVRGVISVDVIVEGRQDVMKVNIPVIIN